MLFDPVYWIMIIAVMAMMGLASKYVQMTFHRFSEVPVRRRITGAQAARMILDNNGLHNVRVERIAGELTDHYDPRDKTLRLSEPVYDSTSISAVGVAAHEAGHALQDKVGYAPLKFRQGIVPIVNFGSTVGNIMIIAGIIMGLAAGSFGFQVAILGLILYSTGALFALVTLPVEFNASSRALSVLTQYGLVSNEEHSSTKTVLNAAALTYVAAAVGAILQVLYWAWVILQSRE